MPTYDGIGSSVTHEIEVVGDVFISNVEGGSLSTQVPFEIFSNVSGMVSPPTDSRQLRLRVQPTTEASPDDSYVTDMGIQNTTDNYFFITAPQNTSNVGDQNTFVISKTSNVGIGTTDPEKPLHVVGDSWITGTLTASNIVGASPVTISSGIVMGSGSTLTTSNLVANTGDNLLIGSSLEVGTSNLFVDTATGRVGIGTNDPKTTLHVSNDLHLQASSEAWNATAGPGLYLRYSTHSGQDGGYIQAIDRSTTTKKPMVLEASQYYFSSGNVGIGTASPGRKLTIYDTNAFAEIRASAEGNISTLLLGTPHDSGAPSKVGIIAQGITNWSRAKLHFCLDDTVSNDSAYVASVSNSRMTIQPDGNVGIGVTNPGVRLHVVSPNIRFVFGDATSGASYGWYTRWNGNSPGAGRTEIINQRGGGAGGIEFGNHQTGGFTFGSWCPLYASSFNVVSDFRFKRDIKTIENGLDTISRLNPTTFEINMSKEDDDYVHKSGFIAQEVYYDTPELRHALTLPHDAESDIETNRLPNYENWGNDRASMELAPIIPYLVKSIQELKARIEALENSS